MASIALLGSLLAFVSSAPGQSPPAASVSDPVPVFIAGEGTHPHYRIPSILRLEVGRPRGRLLAFAEGRGTLADNGTNDVVLRTSDDLGATWSPVRILCDLPGRSLNNPCAVEVRTGPHAGRVILLFQSYAEGCGEHCANPGYDADPDLDRICRTYAIHSDDGGATWSEPREVTREVKRATGATSTASGPGIGIELALGPHRGRLVMPFNEGPFDRWRVYAAVSDDGGDTWRIGENAPNGARGLANEVQMFERADGAVVLNARQHHGAKRRTSAVSTDGGLTWSALADVEDLPDPQCMGGVATSDGSTVVFTGCDSETRRALGTLWISRDGGRSWPEKLLLEPGGFAYSVPVFLAPDEVGILYEGAGYRTIGFRRPNPPIR